MDKNKQALIDKLKLGPKSPNWFRRHRKLVIILSIVAVLVIGGGVATALYFFNQKPKTAVAVVQKPAPKPEPVKYYSPLTGNLVADEAATKQAVTGMMIENSPESRPQSGLKSSGVVFEAIAEGGITRFLVLYQQEKPGLLGPIRSVRLYDLDWLKPFDAGIGHVGGSSNALKEVRNGSYRDLDQFFNSAFYYRATDRYAPHNVYTTFEKIDAMNASKGYLTSTFTGFTRKDAVASKTPNATSVNVTISSALFNSAYSYDATTNTYNRSQAGAPHLDREAGQISPRVVIIMKAAETTVFEDGYRQQITTVGTGQGYIFQNGVETDVTWHKDSQAGQLYFTDADGKDVPLARGQTWITAVPADTGSVTWQ